MLKVLIIVCIMVHVFIPSLQDWFPIISFSLNIITFKIVKNELVQSSATGLGPIYSLDYIGDILSAIAWIIYNGV